jgi:hypothetical protein
MNASNPDKTKSSNVQKQIEDAKRILYDIDPNSGTIIGKSKLYKMYEENMEAYGKAKSAMAEAYAKAQSDPMALQVWPMTGATYQQDVDQAWDRWISADKNKIENALAIIESQSKNSTSSLS